MNKLFKKLGIALAGIAMAVGVGVAVGSKSEFVEAKADEVYKTTLFGQDYNSKGVSGYTNVSFSSNTNNFVVDAINCNNNNTTSGSSNSWTYIKIGGKNGAYTGTLTTHDKIDKAITKVAVTVDAITAGNVTNFKLYTSSNNSTWSEAGSFDKSTGSKIATIGTPTVNLYYKIEVACSKGSSNGLVTISKIEYYIASDIAAQINGSNYAASGISTSAYTAVPTAGGSALTGVTYTYTADNGVTMVSPATSGGTNQTGVFKATGSGNVTITASKDGYAFAQPKTVAVEATTLAASFAGGTSYGQGETISASDLSVSYSTTHISNTALASGYTVSPELPYTFTSEDKTAGSKTFTISMAGATSAVINVTVTAPQPGISITNDTDGVISGKIGDDFVVEINKINDDGLTLEWVLSDDDGIVTFTENTKNIHFNRVGTDATLTVQLKDGNQVKAEDSVTLQTLVPSIAIEEGGSDISEKAIYVTDSGTLTTTTTNAPTGSTVVWSVNNSNMTVDGGTYEATSHGSSIITASLMYDETSVATDSVSFNISALLEPTLVLKYDGSTDARAFTYGQSLDMSKVSLRYTSNKGVITDVDNPTLNFTSLDYIGTKVLTASYNNMTSNGISVKVTNVGAISSTESDIDIITSETENMTNGEEVVTTLDKSKSLITNVELTFKLKVPTTSGGPFTHAITYKLYSSTSADEPFAEYTVSKSCARSSSNNDFSYSFAFNSPQTVAKLSYTWTKPTGSNARCQSFSANFVGQVFASSDQAQAMANYLSEFKTCTSGWADRSDIVTLVAEYNAMINESKTIFESLTLTDYDWTIPGEYDLSTHEYGESSPSKSDVNALIKLQAIVDNYNATKTGQETDLSLILPAANANNAMKVDSTLSNSGATLIIAVASVASLAAIGGYFFIRRKKHI